MGYFTYARKYKNYNWNNQRRSNYFMSYRGTDRRWWESDRVYNKNRSSQSYGKTMRGKSAIRLQKRWHKNESRAREKGRERMADYWKARRERARWSQLMIDRAYHQQTAKYSGGNRGYVFGE